MLTFTIRETEAAKYQFPTCLTLTRIEVNPKTITLLVKIMATAAVQIW